MIENTNKYKYDMNGEETPASQNCVSRTVSAWIHDLLHSEDAILISKIISHSPLPKLNRISKWNCI